MNPRRRLSTLAHFAFLALLLTTLTLGNVAWASPESQRAPTGESGAFTIEPTRQAYDLLLDRFVHELEPSALLNAAWAAAAAGLREAGVTGDLEAPEFGNERFRAWRTFARRLQTAMNLDGSTEAARTDLRSLALQAWTQESGRTAINEQDPLDVANRERFIAEWISMVQDTRDSGPVAPLIAEARTKLKLVNLNWVMIRAMAESAREGHTAFRTPSEYEEYLAWQRNDSRYEGIGVRFRGRNFLISEVFDGSPAEAAGVMMGDQILAVDGQSLEGVEIDDGRRLIRGPSGTSVQLLIRRPTVSAPLTITVARGEIKIQYIRWRVQDEKLGYIQLLSFPDPSVVTEIERALGEFDRAGVRGVVLDLRGNGGGRIDVGIRVASKFIRDGALFQQISRERRQRTITSDVGYWEHAAPLAVLIDGGTASMGEILASAIRENGAGTLVGARTAGVVSAAQVFPLVDGSGLQLTILEIRSGTGVQLNEVGVSPDLAVDFSMADLETGRDPQLEQALAWVRAQPAFAEPARSAPVSSGAPPSISR